MKNNETPEASCVNKMLSSWKEYAKDSSDPEKIVYKSCAFCQKYLNKRLAAVNDYKACLACPLNSNIPQGEEKPYCHINPEADTLITEHRSSETTVERKQQIAQMAVDFMDSLIEEHFPHCADKVRKVHKCQRPLSN